MNNYNTIHMYAIYIYKMLTIKSDVYRLYPITITVSIK